MKPFHAVAMLALLAAPLSACGGKGDDSLGDQVETAAENRADALEDQADNLEDQAERERDGAEDRSEAIDDADVDTRGMTAEQKAAVVANQASVR